ncbi:MAG TPA: hypothetical protein VK923_08700 [Euzebyales bacterium]|nr:hypothetical protein [Euzebyales bacterium]
MPPRRSPRAHIICQRPLAPTAAEAAELVADLGDAPIRLMVNENCRWQPWYRVAHDLLAAGSIGDPTTLSVRMRTGEHWGDDAYADIGRSSAPAAAPGRRPRRRGVQPAAGSDRLLYAGTHTQQPHVRGEDADVVVFRFEDGSTGSSTRAVSRSSRPPTRRRRPARRSC